MTEKRDKRRLLGILAATAMAFLVAALVWPALDQPAECNACVANLEHATPQPLAGAPGAAAPGAVAPRQQVNLPNDRCQWDLVFFLHRDWQTRPQERNLIGWFSSNPKLAKLKAETKVFYFYPDSPEVRRGQYKLSGWPTCVLQTPDGSRYFRVSGNNPNWPKSGDELAADIGAQLQVISSMPPALTYTNAPASLLPIFKKRCNPSPTPPTPPDTTPPPVPQAPPADTPPAPKKDNSGLIVGIVLAVAVGFSLVCAAAAVAVNHATSRMSRG